MLIDYYSTDIRTKTIIQFLINNYDFHLDIDIDEAILTDAYIYENNKKVYIYSISGTIIFKPYSSSFDIIGYNLYVKLNK